MSSITGLDSPDIHLLNAALAGRYAVQRRVGSGGYATVFLAHDLKHERQVALKVLRPELSAIVGSERFLSEIRVTANLQHPHILPLFDSGSANGLLYYIMPFVPGESLRDRLEREKQLPLHDAIRISTQVAAALDYAHRHGIIHRDIKPENILLHDGQALVADFGIALALRNAGGNRLTETGISLGTAEYMSPEQATAERELDARSDVYALGCVLFEMLAGEPPHTGPTVQAIIAKVLTEEPRSITTLRRTVPVHVAAALGHALERLPADRWQSAGKFADALHDRSITREWRATAGSIARKYFWVPLATGALGAALGWWFSRDNRAAPSPVSFALSTALIGEQIVSIAPDGMSLLYKTSTDGAQDRLVQRRLGRVGVTPVPGSEGAVFAAVSPDGKFLAVMADRILKHIPLDSGATIVAGNFGSPRGMSWAPGNVLILGSYAGARGLTRIPNADGPADIFTTPDSVHGEISHRWPIVLPDGETILYTSWRGVPVDSARIGIASLKTGSSKSLNVRGSFPLGMVAQHLVYVDVAGRIMAIPLDLRRRVVTGEPVRLQEGVSQGVRGSSAVLSPAGTLAYVAHERADRLVLVRRGQPPQAIIDRGVFYGPKFSPDGSMIAVASGLYPRTDMLVYTLSSGSLVSLTAGEQGWSLHPAWSADGKRVAYSADRAEQDPTPFTEVWWQTADGSTPAEMLFYGAADINEVNFSPDGSAVVYRESPAGNFNIAYRRLRSNSEESESHTLLGTPHREMQPSLSPDGRWLAYVSNETGRNHVYVRAFPGPPSKTLVSLEEASEPRWVRAGLFYRTAGRLVMVANVTTTPTFAVKSREVVMVDGFNGGGGRGNHQTYDVTPDGMTFVFSEIADSAASVVVIVNWAADVAARLKSGRR